MQIQPPQAMAFKFADLNSSVIEQMLPQDVLKLSHECIVGIFDVNPVLSWE